MPAPEGDAGSALERLDAITRRLRRDCPWDRQQDERSIVPHTVEEAYELADAAASGDDEKLLDELGDVLFQVHFLALLLEERNAGDLDAVAEGMIAKLIRRHPHIFGDAEAETEGEVLSNWDQIKREQEGRDGLFNDIPENLPALLSARKLQRRALTRAADHAPNADLGVVASADHTEALSRVELALERLRRAAPADQAPASPDLPVDQRDELDAAIGELLFGIVDVARRLKVDPELALSGASSRFRAGVEAPRG